MKTCLICKTDITETIQQFGQPNQPICQTCWLTGDDWIYGDEIIVDGLLHGLSFFEACATALEKSNKIIAEGIKQYEYDYANNNRT